MKVYEYKNCSTCKTALKFLDGKGVKYERLPIVEQPPTMTELKRMLEILKAGGGSFKNLFNTSGQQYRELGIGDKTEIEFFDGPHTINGKGTFAFLSKHLNWPVSR